LSIEVMKGAKGEDAFAVDGGAPCSDTFHASRMKEGGTECGPRKSRQHVAVLGRALP
jgi:hypothetical protein